MIEHARTHGLKVRPTCSYVIKMFERFPEDRDLLQD
jgi:predicted GNAT family acetyltransferase